MASTNYFHSYRKGQYRTGNHFMDIRYVLILLLAFFLSTLTCVAQKVTAKTNLFYGAYSRTPNLGVEVWLSSRSTLDLSGGYNWFTSDKSATNKKLVHWLGMAEYRYWTCEKFNGHFFGLHALGGQYNIAGHELPLLFGKHSKQYRFEGWGAGAGISYGYQYIISNRWSAEATIGVGYARLHYDKFRCETCGDKIGTENRNYWGPTKIGISVMYFFK